MRKIIFIASVLLFGIQVGGSGHAEIVKKADNQQSSANSWVKRSVAVIRVLDKLESRVTLMQIPVGQSAQYKTLTITPQACVVRPPAFPEDSAAFLLVTDSRINGYSFSSWILSAEPSVSIFEHPLYNISIKGCIGPEDKRASMEVPSRSGQPKQDGQAKIPASLEQSLENSLQSQH